MIYDPRFPDDETGDVLREMAAAGVDLVSPRVVDFEHCFPDEASARRFSEAVRATVLETKVISPEPDTGRDWEVQCRQRMVPTHAAVTECEQRLAAAAQELGGYADGWGTLSDQDGFPVE